MAYQVRTISVDLPIKWEVGMQFAYFQKKVPWEQRRGMDEYCIEKEGN